MGDPDGLYHVFLCYKSEDIVSARAVRDALVERGRSVFLDVIEGEVWAPLLGSVKQALARSRTLVALMTKNFPISPHCREELHLALTAAYQLDAGSTSRVMAVLQGVSADDVRPGQLTAYRLPHSGTPPADLVEAIVRNVEAHEGVFGDAPQPPAPVWYPRERPTDLSFRGRYAELWDIHSGLRARDKDNDKGPPVFAVSGLGGLGKTSLSLQYARLFARDHPGGVFVLDFAGSDSRSGAVSHAVTARFRENLAMIAARLDGASAENVVPGLNRLGHPYLWILDDLPATADPALVAEMSAPTSAGRTLITTRSGFSRFASRGFALAPLGAQDGVAVLTSRRPARQAERAAVRDIVALLAGHCLGLALAAGLTDAPDFAGYQALLADLSSTVPDRLENAHRNVELPTWYPRPLSRVLLRSFESLDGLGKDVMYAASVLAPTLIPTELLAGMVRRTSRDQDTDPAEAVAQAVARGMLATTGAGCTMHALVARAVRTLVEPPSLRARLRDAALAELIDAVEATRRGYLHGSVLDHLPHVRAVAGLLAGGDRWTLGQSEIHLVNEAGRTLIEAGQSREALANAEALYEACAGADVDWYTSCVVLHGLANAYSLEGQYSKAMHLNKKVAVEFTAKLGPTAQDTLTVMNNLGKSYLELDRNDEAYKLLATVYRRRRDHPQLGPTARDTLITLNNLAVARGRLGASATERTRHRRIAHRYWLGLWSRWRRTAEPDDPYRLDALNGLALGYRALGMLDEAVELAGELYRLRLGLLGRDHPDTVGALENWLVIRQEARGRGR